MTSPAPLNARLASLAISPAVLTTNESTLEPLRVEHYVEMAAALNDASLHTFTGGAPASEEQLGRLYEFQVQGRSLDGQELWLNWIVRDDATGQALGFVQATIFVCGDQGGAVANLAWVIGTEHQGRRIASRASAAMVEFLRAQGVTSYVADVHPEHAASQGVARGLGMHPTDEMIEGEQRWAMG